MNPTLTKLGRIARQLSLGGFVVVVGGSAAFLAAKGPAVGPAASAAPIEKGDAPLHRTGADAIIVAPEVIQGMKLTTGIVATAQTPITLAPFQGSLGLDPNLLVRIHGRFAGEVMSIGTTQDDLRVGYTPGSLLPSPRPLRVGDRIHKGDLLAVIWSKDLGEKKSELVDAVSKLRSDTQTLQRLQKASEGGSIPERTLRDAERAVEADRIVVDRVERTLRSWRLTDEEIVEIRAEADRINRGEATRTDSAQWARVEVRAPQDGVVLEKNLSVGDIVDTTNDLFKIGDLSHLVVWVHVYEEDLPLLQSLTGPVTWTITVPSIPGSSFTGTIEQIGAVIDPNQHTALAAGRVENRSGMLKVGQYVTATVKMPPPVGQLELPSDAVIEDGRESVVFVQPNPDEPRYLRVPVSVARRFRNTTCVKADGRLHAGDRVVTAGALLLRDAMDQLPPPK